MGSLCAAIFPQVGTGYKALQRSVLDQIKLTKTETKIKPYLSFCLRINITRTLRQSSAHMGGLRRNKNNQRQ